MVRTEGMLEQGAYLRAARALLDWSQADLASAADVALTTVKRLEKGERGTKVILNALLAALEAGGVKIAASQTELAGLDVEGIVARIRKTPNI